MLMLDTDIMVDLIREYPPATRWLELLPEPPVVPGLGVMELLNGCRNKVENAKVFQSVKAFEVFWPTLEDCQLALADFAHGHLSHNLGLLDALVGACARGQNATLCTFNQKHFQAMPGLKTEEPYPRGKGLHKTRVP